MKKSWRKLAPWLRWTILLVGGLFLLLFLIVLVEHIRGARQLAAWKATMIAKGEKLTVDELRPKPPLPEDNGSWLLLGAATALERQAGPQGLYSIEPPGWEFVSPTRRIPTLKLKSWDKSGSTNDWETISQVMTGATANLEQVRNAAARPALDFGVDYGSLDQFHPHVSQIKNVVRWLALAAVYEAHRTNLDTAIANQEAIASLMIKYREEKLLISQLVALASGSMGLASTWNILQADGWTDAQLARLQETWSRPGSLETMLDSMAMERNMNLHRFERLRAGDPAAIKELQDLWSYLFGRNTANSTNLLEILLSQFHISDEGFTSQVKLPLWRLAYADQASCQLAKTWQDYIDRARAKIVDPIRLEYPVEPKFYDMLSTVGPAPNATAYDRLRFWPTETMGSMVQAIIMKPMRFEAERQLTVTAIALKRYALRNGKHPDSLAALVPAFLPRIPVDIYCGQPLHYRTEPDGSFLLYSVGEDGGDDLGEHANYLVVQNGVADLIWPQPATPAQIAEWEKQEKR